MTTVSAGTARRRLVRIAAAAGGAAIAICAALGACGWVASSSVMHPAAPSFTTLRDRYRAVPFQALFFDGAGGTRLTGRFFRGSLRATIVVSHGYAANQDQMLPWVSFLHQAGFSVFTYDMRGCGQSGGAITFGALEQRDLISAVDYLSTRPDVGKDQIAALGFSLGGATTIMAAAADKSIRAVVDDSGYAEIGHWFSTSIVQALLHPTDPYSALSLQFVQWRTGIDAAALRPDAQIALISPRPVLIIQGTADTDLPLRNSAENYAAARQPKTLWWVKGAGHGQTLQVAGPAYVRRVVAFFRRALRV
jgi:pimeloyl-ACP methyl ester carboxylesterase